MSRLRFLGVGEAFDAKNGTSSFLYKREDGNSLLVDCGYACTAQLFEEDINKISVIYLTHFHADHVFGLPALLFRMFQDGREESLCIVSQFGGESFVRQLCETAYPGMWELLTYKVVFEESETNFDSEFGRMSFAMTEHPLRNFAIKLQTPELTIAFSGDGALTDESRELFKGSDVLVHEAFCEHEAVWGHESLENVLSCLGPVKHIFVVHMHRGEREKICKAVENVNSVCAPELGEEVCLLSLK